MAPTDIDARGGEGNELVVHEASLASGVASDEQARGVHAFGVIPNKADAGLGFKLNPAELDAATNEHLRAHAVQAPWAHVFTARALYSWFERLNAEFFDGILSPPAIAIERLRKGVLGKYHAGRDGLGLSCHITISDTLVISTAKGRSSGDERGGDSRAGGVDALDDPQGGAPSARVIAVLAHEMIHAWEDAVSGYGSGGWYHGDAFQAQAERIGIPTTKKGEYRGVTPTGRLAALLSGHGITFTGDLVGVVSTGPRDTASRSRLAKWTCGCTIVRASAGVDVKARCCECSRPFLRDGGAPPATRQSTGSPEPARSNRPRTQPSGQGAVVIPFRLDRTSAAETEKTDGP